MLFVVLFTSNKYCGCYYYARILIVKHIPVQALLFKLCTVRRERCFYIPSMPIHPFNANDNIRTSTMPLEEDNNSDNDGGGDGDVASAVEWLMMLREGGLNSNLICIHFDFFFYMLFYIFYFIYFIYFYI